MVLWRQRNIFDMIATLHLLLNIMGPRRRCSIKSYASKSRYLGHTVQEKWKANKHRRWIRQLIIIQAINGAILFSIGQAAAIIIFLQEQKLLNWRR